MGEGYLDLVRKVGNTSALAKISRDALQAVFDQAVSEKDKLSGVSLDQEAADLIRFQQAYQASAQIIQTSTKMFDSILGIR
jgi:flagellar hook-associated protein FlgK